MSDQRHNCEIRYGGAIEMHIPSISLVYRIPKLLVARALVKRAGAQSMPVI
jgi:hypothetical protein